MFHLHKLIQKDACLMKRWRKQFHKKVGHFVCMSHRFRSISSNYVFRQTENNLKKRDRKWKEWKQKDERKVRWKREMAKLNRLKTIVTGIVIFSSSFSGNSEASCDKRRYIYLIRQMALSNSFNSNEANGSDSWRKK